MIVWDFFAAGGASGWIVASPDGGDSNDHTVEVELIDAGWSISRVRCADATDKVSFIGAFVIGLNLPDWVGSNWDAFADVVTDAELLATRRLVIVLDGFEAFRSAAPNDAATARSIMLEAIDEARSADRSIVFVAN